MVIPQFTMSESDNKTLARAHEQRKIRWNGKNKYGSYEAYDDEIRARKFQRDQQRAAIKRAEENGEFIPAKTSGVARVHAEAPKLDYRVRPGAFAALVDDDDSSDEDEEEDERIVKLTATLKADEAALAGEEEQSVEEELLSKEREEAVPPMLGGNDKREANLTKPTWFEMCDSDEEE